MSRPTESPPMRAPLRRERRHTLLFLEEIRPISPVFLDTGVDMTEVRRHRAAGDGYSTVAYVLHAAARVLARHPEANAAVQGRRRPRVAWYPTVNAKLTLDKIIREQRVVVSTVLPDAHLAGLDEIQRRIDHFKAGDVATMPEFAPMRALHRLPLPLARLAYRLAVRPLAKRATTMGTLAVTSLGHRPVDGFYSVGGATITLGLGRTAEQPVVRDGAIVIAPVMRLSLTFDHRVIDGAEAADVLAEIKESLETCEALVQEAVS
uniref:PyrD3 n=1 Tax=Streptomyces rugosporus TaxID=295838 RepID=K7R6F3_STRRG|nr:PyrD3 [Streptomyces rugosporus]